MPAPQGGEVFPKIIKIIRRAFARPAGVLINLGLLILLILLAPPERTLGARLGWILFHGAWAWAGLLGFGAAGLAGLAGLGERRLAWQRASRILAWTALLFWMTYLPMSLAVQQSTWGGIFWDEPRMRIPLTFALVGLLLQGGLWLVRQPRLDALGNLLFGLGLVWNLSRAENVLHPDAPLAGAETSAIGLVFFLMLGLSLLLGAQIALWLKARQAC